MLSSRLRIVCLFLVVLLAHVGASAMLVAQRGNQLFINGKPATLTFARGCSSVQDLPSYCALGFNTLLVTVDSPGPRALDDIDALITAAEEAGLFILIEMANGTWSADRYANIADQEYLDNATYYLDEVVPRLQKHPRIVGWIISTVDEEQSLITIGGFSDYLARKYGTIDALIDAWSDKSNDGKVKSAPFFSSFTMLDSLLNTEKDSNKRKLHTLGFTSPAAVQHLIATYTNDSKGMATKISEEYQIYQQYQRARDVLFQSYLQSSYQGDFSQLLASWRLGSEWNSSTWSEITVEEAATRIVSSPLASPGASLDFARFQSLAAPALINWWAEQLRERSPGHLIFAGAQHRYRTLVTLPYSVNGVLAECFPGYTEPDPEGQNPHAIDIARRGNQFIVLAGVLAQGVPAENMINAIYDATLHGASGICITDWSVIRQSISQANAHSLAGSIYASLTDIRERSLLGRTPAPTAAIVYSPYAPSLGSGKRSLYGYMINHIYPGPASALFLTMRQGTTFGQFDFLAANDLTRFPLSRYKVIILPSVLDLPQASQDALLQFTQMGGTVVADLSLATMQANKNLHFLPQTMMRLFNVRNVPGLRPQRLNMEVAQPESRFPNLLPGVRTNGMNSGYMITQAAQMIPLGGTQLLFSTVASTKIQKPVVKPRKVLPLEPVIGMFIYRQGKGVAIYAPFPLYHFWTQRNELFGQFHHDLLGAGASVAMLMPIEFLPARAEVAYHDDGSVYVWTRDATRPMVVVHNPARLAYDVDNGHCDLEVDRTVLRYTISGFHTANPLPIAIAPAPFTVNFAALQVDADGLEFEMGVSDDYTERTVALTIWSGVYPVLPGSRHQLSVVSGNGTQTQTVQADAQGVINLPALPARSRIRITNPNSITVPTDRPVPGVVVDFQPTE